MTSSETQCSTWRRVLTSRKEIVPSWRDEELARPGAVVAGLGEDPLGRRVELGDLLVGEERRGGLLDELLVAALQRAVAGGHDDDVAVLVGEALGLDVAGLVEELLDQALAATEGGDGLADRGLVGVGDLLERASDLEAAAAAAEDGLDRDRQPVGLRELDDLVGVLHRVLGARRERGLRLVGDVLGPGLVAQRLDRGGRGTDPDQPGVDDGLGELGVLGEEPVAGVDGISTGVGGDLDDLGDVEVGLGRGGATEGVGLVGEPHEEGVAVRVGVDRDRPDPGVLAGADDADGDLAAVGDEDLLQAHARLLAVTLGWAARAAGGRTVRQATATRARRDRLLGARAARRTRRRSPL